MDGPGDYTVRVHADNIVVGKHLAVSIVQDEYGITDTLECFDIHEQMNGCASGYDPRR